MDNYVVYHLHTEDSLVDSCTKYQDYIELCKKYGIPAISFTEHGKIINWTEKWNACKEAGIKYMHGVEIYLTEQLFPKVRDNYHTILIAKNYEGVLELNELVSKSFDEEHFYYNNRLSFDEFLGISNNIISTSACLKSPLRYISDDDPVFDKLVDKYDFLEIQAHNVPEQVEFNRRLLEISKAKNKPLIAGTDTHSSSKYKAECRKVLLAAKGMTYGDEDTFDLSFKTRDELEEMFHIQSSIPDEEYKTAIDNTFVLANMVEEFELDTSIKYPILYGTREADSEKFLETIEKKFNEKIEKHIIPEEQIPGFREAIDEEVRVFQKLHMDGFMLSMSELISWCWDNDIVVGPARGSVGGSRVAYVTDVTDLNSETWGTVFSRFCNEDREEIGDIDIDCIESDRPAIFNYITERFGKDKTARVSSFGTLQDKAAIDEIGRYLARKWEKEHENDLQKDNPWSIPNIKKIKSEYSTLPEDTKLKYPELFYYFDGLVGTKVSQSIHPAGMVISPITLPDHFGVFDKDGERCLFLDMDNVHDFTGLAKYDFLVLKTVQVIKDTCDYIGIKYPRTHEINWNDTKVWNDMIKCPFGIFQFESGFAFDSLKKFKAKSIFDMSIVTACIRPSGASYRDDLLARVKHKNPSDIIDNLLKDNLGYLIYQEDTIKFLQQICGLSGSEADNIRRAIGRKQKDRLDKAMPSILEGYCNKSSKSREEAEEEAKEFLQVIEDSASYQFGYNHSIAYCLLGYLCAYFRCYYPIEFATAFLNNAANDDDIKNGTALAGRYGIKVTIPKWGVSKSGYYFNKENREIGKGLSSVKYIGKGLAEELYDIANTKHHEYFMDVLSDLRTSKIDQRQLNILIKIGFFSRFGNQRELLRLSDMFYGTFKRGDVVQIKRENVDSSPLGGIIAKYSTHKTKKNEEAKNYTIFDIRSVMIDTERHLKSLNMPDLDNKVKIQNFKEVMGYYGYASEDPEDLKKFYVSEIYPLHRKRDGKQFGYSIIVQSIGSGKESRFTVFNSTFNKDPLKAGDIFYCCNYARDGIYFTLTDYYKDF